MRRVRWSGLALALATLLGASGGSAQSPPSPPLQPNTGPGGSTYAHSAVVVRGPYWARRNLAIRNYSYYIFEPAEPTPATAPVVLFLHGWLAYRPYTYREWINHIVKKGYVVVWVRYDAGLRPPAWWADHALVAWKDALARLSRWEGVRPERDPQGRIKTAIVGHSAGGYLAAILAARTASPATGVPTPYAVTVIEPGGLGVVPSEDLSRIDPGTKLVVVAGDEDTVVCTDTAVAIWQETPQISDANRDFLLALSDRSGSPAQIANHFFPTTSGVLDTAAVDARDFYVTFKLSVGLLSCAFYGDDCPYALGDGASVQVDMGLWSNGLPVRPLVWVVDPAWLQATCQER